MFNDSLTSMLKTDSMNNVSTTATGELLNFTVNIWFFIQKLIMIKQKNKHCW